MPQPAADEPQPLDHYDFLQQQEAAAAAEAEGDEPMPAAPAVNVAADDEPVYVRPPRPAAVAGHAEVLPLPPQPQLVAADQQGLAGKTLNLRVFSAVHRAMLFAAILIMIFQAAFVSTPDTAVNVLLRFVGAFVHYLEMIPGFSMLTSNLSILRSWWSPGLFFTLYLGKKAMTAIIDSHRCPYSVQSVVQCPNLQCGAFFRISDVMPAGANINVSPKCSHCDTALFTKRPHGIYLTD